LLNGFVGFQWAEDGTPQSIWSFRISSLFVFGVAFFISIATFQGLPGFSPSWPIGLFIIYFVVNGAMLIIYSVMQIILVVNTLDDRWPLGDILFGLAFFILGQIFELAISVQLCNAAKHYIDGYFFGTICSLLAVMMVYKYWDSITKEDLEFSVGGKPNVWEIKGDEYEPFMKPNNSSMVGGNMPVVSNAGAGGVNDPMTGLASQDDIEEEMARMRMRQ